MTGGRSALLRRVLQLEGRQTVRQDSEGQPERRALMAEVEAVLSALPDVLRRDVEARGARGVAALIEATWEAGHTGEVSPELTLSAYRAAFGTVAE
ncbi:hypothetical protein [Deinococcus sonorensis]|uniref:Uncharacterized protein n=2 Tax=Deinococcus sonorensis TaxID=309891 RepID=A0AAU7UC66_9DEIO